MSKKATDIEEQAEAQAEAGRAPIEAAQPNAPATDAAVDQDLLEVQAGFVARLKSLIWPEHRGRRLIILGVLLLLPIAGSAWFVLAPKADQGQAQPALDQNIAARDAALVNGEAVDPAPAEIAPPEVATTPGQAPGARTLLERGELAMRNRSYEEAMRLLEEALRLLPSSERVTRGRVFEDLAKVSQALGRESQARIFEERAKELLREVYEPAHLIEAAEGKAAVGDWRAAQALFSRFLLVSGGLEGEAQALARRAQMGLAQALEAEWRATEDPQALDRLPRQDLRFGVHR